MRLVGGITSHSTTHLGPTLAATHSISAVCSHLGQSSKLAHTSCAGSARCDVAAEWLFRRTKNPDFFVHDLLLASSRHAGVRLFFWKVASAVEKVIREDKLPELVAE